MFLAYNNLPLLQAAGYKCVTVGATVRIISEQKYVSASHVLISDANRRRHSKSTHNNGHDG